MEPPPSVHGGEDWFHAVGTARERTSTRAEPLYANSSRMIAAAGVLSELPLPDTRRATILPPVNGTGDGVWEADKSVPVCEGEGDGDGVAKDDGDCVVVRL